MGIDVPNLKEMEIRLNDLATKITNLEAKIHRRQKEIDGHAEQLVTLRAKHKTAHQMLEQVQNATHEELKNVKSGWEAIIKEMQQVLDKIASSY